jgi:hypothetical protein
MAYDELDINCIRANLAELEGKLDELRGHL